VVDWDAWRAQREAQLLAAIAAMAELERQAEILEIGDADTRMTVYPGDTWETLSVRAYGRVDNADLLRRANGAGIGERPKPGSILVPANR
jgi:predicted Zn-dependent protease